MTIKQIVGIIIVVIFLILFLFFWKDIPGWLKMIADKIYAPINNIFNLSPGPKL